MNEQVATRTPTNAVAERPAITMLRPMFFRGMEATFTFDTTTPDGAEKLIQATMGELPDLMEMIGKRVEVQHVFSHPATSADPNTGGISEFTRTVIFDANGNAWQCGSDGVLKSLEIFRMLRKDPPWNPPISCEVRLTRLSGARQWMTLVPNVKALFENQKHPKPGKS